MAMKKVTTNHTTYVTLAKHITLRKAMWAYMKKEVAGGRAISNCIFTWTTIESRTATEVASEARRIEKELSHGPSGRKLLAPSRR